MCGSIVRQSQWSTTNKLLCGLTEMIPDPGSDFGMMRQLDLICVRHKYYVWTAVWGLGSGITSIFLTGIGSLGSYYRLYSDSIIIWFWFNFIIFHSSVIFFIILNDVFSRVSLIFPLRPYCIIINRGNWNCPQIYFVKSSFSSWFQNKWKWKYH